MILSILSIIGFVVFVLVLLAGLFLVPLGLPGTWLIVIDAFVYSLIADFQMGRSDFWVLLFVIILAIVGEILEFGIGVLGSKEMKVSNGAIVCSIIGGIVGVFVGFPLFLVGTIIGLLIGVFLGAFVYEMLVKKDVRIALDASIKTFFSRVMSIFAKTFIAFVMVVYLLMKTL